MVINLPRGIVNGKANEHERNDVLYTFCDCVGLKLRMSKEMKFMNSLWRKF